LKWSIVPLALVAGLYALTLPTSITFEDAGLFQQVCSAGGIAHPPGYPLFTLICSPLFSLDLNPVVTGNLISAFFGLCTLAVLLLILRSLKLSIAVSCFTAFLFGISLEFWSQAIIIEVYTLNTLLMAVLVWLCLRMINQPSPGNLVALGLTSGLALSNHWPLAIASAPGLLLILFSNRQMCMSYLKRPALLSLGLVCMLAGLIPYTVMYLQPEGTFGYSGHLKDMDALLRYVSRDSYSSIDQSQYAGIGDKLSFAFWFPGLLVSQLGWLFALVAGFGLFTGIKKDPMLHSGLLIIAICNSLLLITLLGFEFTYSFQTAFSHYPLTAYLCMAIWLGLGIEASVNFARNHSVLLERGLVLVMVTATLSTLFINYRQNDRSGDNLAEEYANTVLESLPENSILVVDADAQIGAIGFMHRVMNKRPDIDLYETDNAFTRHRLPSSTTEKRNYLLGLSRQRPVFAIEVPWLPIAAEYGLYQSVGESADRQYIAEPSHLPFLNTMASGYTADRYRTRFNRGFVHQSLIGAGHYLLSRVTTGDTSKDEVDALIRVQRSFPGAIGVVSTALATGSTSLTRDAMLSLLTPHEENFPVSSTPVEIAQYYTLMAALQNSNAAVKNYLKKAFDAMPDDRNPVCITGVDLNFKC
jgi:hypothetical protein